MAEELTLGIVLELPEADCMALKRDLVTRPSDELLFGDPPAERSEKGLPGASLEVGNGDDLEPTGSMIEDWSDSVDWRSWRKCLY